MPEPKASMSRQAPTTESRKSVSVPARMIVASVASREIPT